MNGPATRIAAVTVELLRYLGASIAGTALHYGVLLMLTQGFAFSPLWASTCGAMAGAVTIYTLSYVYVFRSSQMHLVALGKFGLVAAVGLVVNGTVLSAALSHLNWPLVPAQVLATGAQFLLGFIFNRNWIF